MKGKPTVHRTGIYVHLESGRSGIENFDSPIQSGQSVPRNPASAARCTDRSDAQSVVRLQHEESQGPT